MNDLAVCNENSELINMQIDACNTTLDFFDVISKKGSRDFITQMGKLNLKAKEIQFKENELQTKFDIAEMKEDNKFRLAAIDFRKEVKISEIESNTQIQKVKIKAVSDFNKTKLNAEKEIGLEKMKTEQLRIKEQSKCMQKLLEEVQKAYDRKFDFYGSQLKVCMEYFSPQIQSLDQEIAVLIEQYNSNFENQETHMIVHKQIKQLQRAKDDINEKFERIMLNLTTASKLAKLEYSNSFGGF